MNHGQYYKIFSKPGTQTPRSSLLPLLPLRDIVIFPHMVAPLFVGRPKSVKRSPMP
jgi:ATP-dependent Lon protease